jgi:hypothetical protein
MKEERRSRKEKILIEWLKLTKRSLTLDGKNKLKMKSEKLKMVFLFLFPLFKIHTQSQIRR